MSGSRRAPLSFLALQAASAACDALGRLALPFAVLGVARGSFEPALTASVVATSVSLVRSWLGARATEWALVDAWARAAAAARRRPVAELPRRREDEESVAMLLQGVWDEASHRAVTVPQTAGVGLTLAVLAVASIVSLGAWVTLAGAALLLSLGALGLALARGLRTSQRRAWKEIGGLSMSMRLLLEGALELRAAGREAFVEREVVGAARRVAEHQAAATAASMRAGLLPASIAVLAVAAPLRGGARWIQEVLAGDRIAESTVLGAATLVAGIAAARTWELWATSAPLRRDFTAFATAHPAENAAPRPAKRPLDEATIVFRGFAHDWGTGTLTPVPLDLVIEPRSGVVLSGSNGSGKTTALLGLLGALRPTRGACEIDGTPACDLDPATWVGSVGYVPQDPLIMPGESLAWHCRLHEDATDEVIDEALRASGLTDILASRARSRRVPVRDLPAGELSGGERRKLVLARALQRPRALYVFDEPEAGLDVAAREALRHRLEGLATHARVVAVAHDRSAIPDSFREVALVASRLDRDGSEAAEA